MNDLQIEYFLSVAKHLSFTKAARELFVSQPAISRQILAMEEDLGYTLFERTNKSVKLTETGEMFFHFFTDYKNELNNIKVHAQLVSESRQRVLRLGIVDHWDISPFFVPALDAFVKLHSQVRVQIYSYDVNEMENALSTDAVDMVMTIDPVSGEGKGMTSTELWKVPRVLLYSKNHRLAQEKQELSPIDFEDETFLVISEGEHSFYGQDLVKGFCKPYGFVPKVLAVNSTDSMMAGIQCRMGVAIVDAWSRELSHPEFGHITLDSSHIVRLMWKTKWTDPVIQDFVLCMEEAVERVNKRSAE